MNTRILTNKGKVYVHALQEVPEPEQIWILPNTHPTEIIP